MSTGTTIRTVDGQDWSDALASRFAAVVGERNALFTDADTERYRHEWRGIYRGVTPAVLRPGSTSEVAEIVKLAAETGTPVVPQGGNTGLMGGAVPDESGREIVVSLERMSRIREIDAKGNTMTVDAGAVLETLQRGADEVDRLFPLALGSQGSCQIGGNISTNAGGTGVLAYGSTRDLVLGLEVVLASGEIWNGLRGLKKDNTGYAMKHLFIGAEGTLGIVTGAMVKLFPKPKGRAVAFAGISDPHAALELFNRAQAVAGGSVTGFELMPRIILDFVVRHVANHRDPLGAPHPWYALIEISSGRGQEAADADLEALLAEGFEKGLVADAAIAQSEAQADAFWAIRHDMSEAQGPEGASMKHDVAVPLARVPELLERADMAIRKAVEGARPVMFGHMGDGNIHLNVSQPSGGDPEAFMSREAEVNALVYDIVGDLGGSVSAEHGIGRTKRELLRKVKPPLELEMMRAVKRALDPQGIMNPGRVL